MPFDIQKRAMTVGTAANGGYLVATELKGNSFIDVLRNSMLVERLGATFMTGLVGTVDIPRDTVATNLSWVAEDTAGSEVTPTLDKITLSNKVATGFTIVTRKLRQQSSIDVDSYIASMLAKSLGRTYDAAAFNGTGASNQPRGVRNQSGINVVATGTNGSAPSWDFVVDMEGQIAVDNADQGMMKYVSNSLVKSKLKRVEKASSTAKFLFEEGLLNDLELLITNAIPFNITKGSGTNLSTMLLGYWPDLIVGQWGNMELLVNPYITSTTGSVTVSVFQDYDIAVKHPESFCELSGLITT